MHQYQVFIYIKKELYKDWFYTITRSFTSALFFNSMTILVHG